MASSCGQSQSSVGVGESSSNATVVSIIETKRNPAVWCNYDLCEMSNGIRKARCKKCGAFFKETGNTTLKNHANTYCKAVKYGTGHNQSTMANDGTMWQYEASKVRDRMAKFVIQESLPFDHFDNPRLTRLIQETLQPRYNNVSRSTLRRDVIKMWKIAKDEMILGFQSLETGVNLTCDVWTAPHGSPDSYLCVTSHWVNPKTWQMMKRTIAFELFGYPHTGENLYQILDYVIKSFKLEGKVFSISFDNASNNTAAVNQLKLKYKPACEGAFFHSRCVAHIINLVVQDGLSFIAQIKEAFKQMLRDIFSSSNARYHRYMKFCVDSNALWLGPNWDVPTRWNSTCNMFESALRQKDTLRLFHDLLADRNRFVTPFPESSWYTIQVLTDMLVVFKEATTLLSGVYYPTSPLVLRQIWLMCQKLSAFEMKGEIFENMVQPMKEKLVKYFKNMPPVISCAAALNPVLNVNGVETLLTNIANDLGLTAIKPAWADNEINAFNDFFASLFDVYATKYGGSTPVQEFIRNEGASGSSSHTNNDDIILYNTLINDASKRARGTVPSSELSRYTKSNFIMFMSVQEFGKLDVLGWWRDHESQFPILAAMARDLLTVQASTVASESAFSVSGRVISPRRTKLTPLSVEVCICLKDYLDGIERIQNISPLEGELEKVEQEIHEEEIAMGMSVPLTAQELTYQEELHNFHTDD